MERYRNTERTLAHDTLQDSTRGGGSPRARLERADARATGRVKTHHHKHNVRQRYEVLETLGAGTYGKVNRAVKRQCGQTVAIKSIRKVKLKDDLDRAHIQREIEITASLLHPNIIRLYEVFESRERIVMVMEYASRGELYEYIQEKARLSEEEAKHFFRQITAAVQHCHRNGVVHRDLKLENILLDKDLNVKLADFGLSNHYMRGHFLDTFCGSPLYASPEIINGHPYQGPEVDCWSLGVLLFALVYGSMPFDGASYTILKEQISEGQYKTPDFQSDACSLIRWMLTVRVEDRATVEDIANHWWLNAEFPVTMCDSKSNVPNHPDTKNHMEITFTNPYNTKNYVALPLPLESPYHNQLTKLPKKGILKNLYDHVENTSPQCTQRSESVGSGQTSFDRTVEIKAADIQRKGILKCNRKFSDVPLTTITPTWPHSVSSKHCMGLEFEGGEQQEMELEIKISLWKTQEPETMGLQFSSK